MERTNHWAALYFILLMTFGNYVLFNLLVAILVEGFKCQNDLFVECYSEDDLYYSETDLGHNDDDQNTTERRKKRDEQVHLCKKCKKEMEGKAGDGPKNKKQVARMSREMRSYLQSVVKKNGFETRMTVVCANCEENIDKGPSYIVAKEDIEHGKDFEKFREYRKLTQTSNAYRRPSKMSLNESKKKEKGKFLQKITKKISNVDTRNLYEKLRDFYNNRYSHSLFIWPPNSEFRRHCKLISQEGWFDFIILVFIAGNCITLGIFS